MIENYFDTPNTTESANESEYDDLLNEIQEPLKHSDEYEPTETEGAPEEAAPSPEVQKEQKKRFSRLNKLGAKGIVKAVDISAANIARKIAFADSAEPYRADPEALEDLTEILEEIIPSDSVGEKLKIPVWLQLLIYVLIAFLPVMLTALSDRKDNRYIKEHEKELKLLKKEKKILKMQLQREALKKELLKESETENKTSENKEDSAEDEN